MRSENQKLFSLAAIVVAAVLFGMVLSGGLDLTAPADAGKPEAREAPAVPRMVAPDFADLADRVVPSVVSVFTTDVVTAEEREKGRPRDLIPSLKIVYWLDVQKGLDFFGLREGKLVKIYRLDIG